MPTPRDTTPGPSETAGPPRRDRRKPRSLKVSYVGLGEASTYLGVAEKTLRNMVQRGELAAYRLGLNGNWRFKIVDLDAALIPVPADTNAS